MGMAVFCFVAAIPASVFVWLAAHVLVQACRWTGLRLALLIAGALSRSDIIVRGVVELQDREGNGLKTT